MSVETKTFAGRVEDGYGCVSEEAIIVLHSWLGATHRSGRTEGLGHKYKIDQVVDRMAYEVSYYHSKKTMDAGKKLRPLEIEEGEGFTRALEVDLSLPQVKQILNENNDPDEKMLKAMQADFRHRMMKANAE